MIFAQRLLQYKDIDRVLELVAQQLKCPSPPDLHSRFGRRVQAPRHSSKALIEHKYSKTSMKIAMRL